MEFEHTFEVEDWINPDAISTVSVELLPPDASVGRPFGGVVCDCKITGAVIGQLELTREQLALAIGADEVAWLERAHADEIAQRIADGE